MDSGRLDGYNRCQFNQGDDLSNAGELEEMDSHTYPEDLE